MQNPQQMVRRHCAKFWPKYALDLFLGKIPAPKWQPDLVAVVSGQLLVVANDAGA
jgi:hypothetical protein